jgi:hypothetical protein
VQSSFLGRNLTLPCRQRVCALDYQCGPSLRVETDRSVGLEKGPTALCRRRLAADGRAAIRNGVRHGASVSQEPVGGHELHFGGVPAAIVRRVDMFESLEDVDKKSTGRTMKIIWIVIAVAAVVLTVVSFM